MNIKRNGLSYVGDVDTLSRYTLFMEGRRVMDILVDNGVTELIPEATDVPPGVSLHPIAIAMVDAPAQTAQKTAGLAVRRPYMDETGVGARISSTSVSHYVEPRAAKLLARLFVPAA